MLIESPAGTQPARPPIKLGTSRCQCTGCNEYFSSTHAFDKHRTGTFAKPGEWQGTRRCMTTAEMLAKGFQLREPGVWVTGARPANRVPAKAQP